ncbi:pentatricopeptide repeat-containing protein [Tanacetum coccineum]
MASRILNISLNFYTTDYTLLLFKSITYPDTFCVNTVIKSYALCNLPSYGVGFYFEMLRDDGVSFRPNCFTFPGLISACGRARELGVGKVCHGQVVKYGVGGSLFVENSLVYMYGGCGMSGDAWGVFGGMCVRDLVSWNSMVDGYVKVGDLGRAHRVFDEMGERNVVSWNVLMTGYLDGGSPGNVLKLFREMVGEGGRGNDTTVVSVVTACGRSCRLKEGRSVHGYVVRMLMGVSLTIRTALIDMYSRCGRPDVAQVIFDGMLIKNLVCWNALITGQSIHGNPKHGLELFDKMLKTGELIPDEVTYVGVLCASARLGLLTEGKNYFLDMTEVFNVKPNFAHYWCMANLYASQGFVNEAVELLKNMRINVNMSQQLSLWAGLLGSCRFKGDVVLGEQIAKSLIADDPLNHLYHVLLIIIYAVAGRWDDVSRMKCMMRERGITVPGFSLLELTEIVNNLDASNKLEDIISGLHENG